MATAFDLAERVIATKREHDAKIRDWKITVGYNGGSLAKDIPLCREHRAMCCEAKAAVAAAQADMVEARRAESKRNSASHELDRRRDAIHADLLRRWSRRCAELAALTRLREPREVEGYLVLADQIEAARRAGIPGSIEYPTLNDSGVLGTKPTHVGGILAAFGVRG